MDANIAQHDKILWLKHQRGGWKAISVYLFSVGWSVGHGTDGRIPKHVALSLDADKTTVTLLESASLWLPVGDGWQIRNFAERQQLDIVTNAKHLASMKANCTRWHGPDCGCWKDHQ